MSVAVAAGKAIVGVMKGMARAAQSATVSDRNAAHAMADSFADIRARDSAHLC